MIDITEVEVGDYLVVTETGEAIKVVGFRNVGPGNYYKSGEYSWPVDEDGEARNPRFLRKYAGALSVFPGEIGSEV